MSDVKNLYNLYDPAYQISSNFQIDGDDWITATFDNSEGTEIKYLNLFCNVSKYLVTDNTYYAYLEIAEVTGNGGIFVTDSATEKENFSDLLAGEILEYKIKALDDFTSSNVILKTYLQFFPGESGTLKFRLSILNEEVDINNFKYQRFGAGEYDFFIDGRNYFTIPEINVKYLIDPSESNLNDMPEATESTVLISGRDGDLVLSTRYEPRSFNIIAYTEDNLEPEEKVAEIKKITKFMHSIKNKTKKIAFLNKDKMYVVKYSGQVVVTEYPKSVRFEIPLKSSSAFGSVLTKTRMFGENTATSNTVEETGFIMTIEGPAQTPVVSMNDYQMKYDNVILEGNKLVINTNNSTVTMITSEGVKTNAALYYNHEYPKIKAGTNEVEIKSGIENPYQVLTEWYDLEL